MPDVSGEGYCEKSGSSYSGVCWLFLVCSGPDIDRLCAIGVLAGMLFRTDMAAFSSDNAFFPEPGDFVMGVTGVAQDLLGVFTNLWRSAGHFGSVLVGHVASFGHRDG